MDITEFTQQVQPRQKRSRLLKYKAEISNLKERGYTDQQIRDWLAKNNINVSREAVRKFKKNHLVAALGSEASARHAANAAPSSATALAAMTPKVESQAEKMRRRLREQQQEAESTLFRHDKTGNNIKG